MWKVLLAFVMFAGLAMYLLSQGGAIDIGGEKHVVETPAVAEHATPTAMPASGVP